MITGAQCRAARALAELTRENLSGITGIEIAIVENFERKLQKPEPEIAAKIQNALEAAGVVFIPENGGALVSA